MGYASWHRKKLIEKLPVPTGVSINVPELVSAIRVGIVGAEPVPGFNLLRNGEKLNT
jgi:hypothetical protein